LISQAALPAQGSPRETISPLIAGELATAHTIK
jgi:hypothetical protein